MIAKFYKKNGIEARNYKLIASKNIDCIPQKGTFIEFSGQTFVADKVVFNIDKSEYAVYMHRV